MIERKENLSVLAYRKLEAMILSGQLKPGERLNEHQLSIENEISRGPIREACHALERAGLVVAVPRKGMFVREVTSRHLDEAYDLRAVLTGLMCGLAAERSDKEDCADLRRLNDEMRAAYSNDDSDIYYAINLKFHDLISEISGNETAKRMYDGLVKETHAQRVTVLSPEETIAEHANIIEAITAGNVERARRLGEAHVQSGKERWHKMRVRNADLSGQNKNIRENTVSARDLHTSAYLIKR